MSPEDLERIRSIVAQVVDSNEPNQLALYVVAIAVIAISGAVSSYFGSYFSARGQQLATQRAFEEMLAQAKQMTAATESIRADVTSRKALDDAVRQGQFQFCTATYTKLLQIQTNLNRLRHGYEVPKDFMNKNDVVPLTEVYNELAGHRFLIAERLYQSLLQQAHKTLEIGQVPRGDEQGLLRLRTELKALQDEFGRTIRTAYGVDEIIAQ